MRPKVCLAESDRRSSRRPGETVLFGEPGEPDERPPCSCLSRSIAVGAAMQPLCGARPPAEACRGPLLAPARLPALRSPSPPPHCLMCRQLRRALRQLLPEDMRAALPRRPHEVGGTPPQRALTMPARASTWHF